jgi:hypothetical protein
MDSAPLDASTPEMASASVLVVSLP